jgi:hypothetical protein
MRLSSAIRAILITLTVAIGFGTAVCADIGRIRFNVVKAGFVIGGSGGSGTLLFHGRYYPLAIGGVSYGFTFGASATDFFGTVSNIRWPSMLMVFMSQPAPAPRSVPVGARSC